MSVDYFHLVNPGYGFHVVGSLSGTEVLISFLVDVFAKNLPDKMLRPVSKGKKYPSVIVYYQVSPLPLGHFL